MPYQIIKRYGHERGFSCCFRQWRANSHCSQLHGYALAFEITLEADTLDARNWVYDYGNFKALKKSLDYWFDHTLVAAKDDPHLEWFRGMHDARVADLRLLESVGCEKFAEHVYNLSQHLIEDGRVRVLSVKVSEHDGNSAVYTGE